MFNNRTPLLRDNPVQLNYGLAVADVTGDGHFEVCVAGFGFRNLILKWNGSYYEDVAPPLLADPDRQSIGVAAADLDGDGLEELYVLNTDTFGGPKRFPDRLFDYGGDAWVDLFSLGISRGVRNMTAGRSVATIDRRGDGRYGFYIANYGGPVRLYELDADGYLIDVAPEAGLNLVTGGRAVIAAPFEGASTDIFATNELGPNFLFINNGSGSFEELAAEHNVGDPKENGRGVDVLDATGNGRLDIVYGNWEGRHRLYAQRDDGTFQDIAPLPMAEPSRVRTVIAADFDNDGYEEIFFNNIGERNRLFGYREREWQQIDIDDAHETLGLGTGAAMGDLNGDGRLELIIAHGESGPQPLSLFHGPENGHGWVRVMPLTQFGAPARGAMVQLEAGGRTQTRVIDGGSGYLCQMEPVAHFGLGDASQIDSIRVQWPDGSTKTLTDPTAEELHKVAYPD